MVQKALPSVLRHSSHGARDSVAGQVMRKHRPVLFNRFMKLEEDLGDTQDWGHVDTVEALFDRDVIPFLTHLSWFIG